MLEAVVDTAYKCPRRDGTGFGYVLTEKQMEDLIELLRAVRGEPAAPFAVCCADCANPDPSRFDYEADVPTSFQIGEIVNGNSLIVDSNSAAHLVEFSRSGRMVCQECGRSHPVHRDHVVFKDLALGFLDFPKDYEFRVPPALVGKRRRT